MKIWLLTGEYPPDYGGGIATYCWHTAQMLRERGHEITVFAFAEGMASRWQVEEPADGLRVVRFAPFQSAQSKALGAFARPSYDAACVLFEYARGEGPPDVIESQEYLGLPYFTMQRRLLQQDALHNVPVVVTAHSPLYLCHQYDRTPAYRFPGYWVGEMERFSLLAADRVIFPSAYLRGMVERELPQVRDRCHVIANPYQAAAQPVIESEAAARRGFLFTAKIQRLKGIEPLLSAFTQLWQAGLDEPLYLLGDDWFDELNQRKMSEVLNLRYKRFIEAGLLRWEGKQHPQVVQSLLRQVRAMILPSLYENYPYAVIEAMAAGCPAVVSRSGGHTEMVEDGLSGYIFSHHNSGELAETIQTVHRLTPEAQQRMGAAAQVRAQQLSGYAVVAPRKEEALQYALDSMKPRTHFPFLRGEQRPRQLPEQTETSGVPGMLSVVIPFYNLGAYLEETLQSFDGFTEIPLELIVVDDGSSDPASLETLASLQERYAFRLERKPNEGLAVARNRGAALARGEFLAFLDADDRIDAAQFYPQALAILRQYSNVSFVGCWVEYFGEGDGYWATWNPEPPYALVHNPLNTSALVYRRADFLAYGQNDPAFAYIMEDYDSLLSLLAAGCRGVAVPDPHFKYRVRGTSMFHATSDAVKVWTYQRLTEKHAALFGQYTDGVINLINANGPGYLYDNPTEWYPAVGFAQAAAPPPAAVLDVSQLPARALAYFALRSAIFQPYDRLRRRFAWIDAVRARVKKYLVDR